MRRPTSALLCALAVAALGVPNAHGAGNPFITDVYTADPDAFVFNDRLWVNTDRDEAPLGASDFLMREWRMYSTTDAVNWTSHGPVMTLADLPWANRNAWAAQMVPHEGKFYWYFPVQKAAGNSMSIGVVVCDSPLGPCRDPLGGPLIDNTTPNHSSFDIDPTVLVDDDGQRYIYWGSFSSPRVGKLKPNMIELEDLSPGGAAIGPRVAGKVGNAVRLNGSSEYVNLPANVTNGLTDFTISTWVNPAAVTTWSRVFDFGANTSRYMFLTLSSGQNPRFAITANGNGQEQQLNGTSRLPVNQWSHIAITHAGNTGRMYVNGALVATNANMTLTPNALGATPNNWIGRAQFNDPLLNAAVDDFHVYDRALSETEVGTLAGGAAGAGNVLAYSFDEPSGATAVDAAPGHRDATIVSPPVKALTPTGLTGYWEAPFLFKRNGLYYMAYARGNPQTGGNPATIDYATATNPLGPWTYRGRILDTVTNTTTNHSAIVEFKGQWYIVYHTGALPGGGEFRRAVSIDKLYFNADGTIQPVVQTLSDEAKQPTAVYNDIALDGIDQHVTLPRGILWNMYDFTLSAWVKLDASRPQQRIFDFGTGTNVNMYLTPEGANGNVRFALTTTGVNGERRVDGTAPLPVGRWVHVAITKSALTSRLYVNGQQVGSNTNMSLYPARLGNSANNWIGRSQTASHPYFDGEIDDFRIYQRGLSADEVAALAVVSTSTPGNVGGTVPATLSLTLGAPATFGAFTPGIDREYTATTTANVISTAGDAALTVSDPCCLANGAFSLPEPLQVSFSKSSWAAPVSNDGVTITFKQHIGANQPLRTGTYAKTLTFTLSTTTP